MSLQLENLEDDVRKLIMEEIERDEAGGNLFFSNRLRADKKDIYLHLLKEALAKGNDDSFALTIKTSQCLNQKETRDTKKGAIQADVPYNAHITLAEGEFNRYYIRGLCRKSLLEGKQLEVYRAKYVSSPRPESQVKIGQVVDAAKLLEDLRKDNALGEKNRGEWVTNALGIPAGPNSGLSVRLKKGFT